MKEDLEFGDGIMCWDCEDVEMGFDTERDIYVCPKCGLETEIEELHTRPDMLDQDENNIIYCPKCGQPLSYNARFDIFVCERCDDEFPRSRFAHLISRDSSYIPYYCKGFCDAGNYPLCRVGCRLYDD